MPLDVIQQWWPLIVTLGAILIWVVRMEGKMLANTREIERLWAQRREDMEMAKVDRQDLKEMLKEVRSDVKTLTEKMVK